MLINIGCSAAAAKTYINGLVFNPGTISFGSTTECVSSSLPKSYLLNSTGPLPNT